MEKRPEDLPPLSAALRAHKILADKALGQHFLCDLNLTRRIVRAAAPLLQSCVIEIGPGPGGLTRAILEAGAQKVILVEQDPRFFPLLEEIAKAYPGRVVLHCADALQIDLAKLCPSSFSGPIKILSNLPYNIGTALLIKWLLEPPSWPPFWESLTLMFQKEVAQRLAAQPGEALYGRLSILAQWRCVPRRLFDIPPQAFVPPPKVTSSVVSLHPCTPAVVVSGHDLARVTQAAFGQRRKMLRSSLKSLGRDPLLLLERVGIPPTQRAEDVSVKEYLHLTAVLAQLEREEGKEGGFS